MAGGDDAESTERRNGAFKLIPKIVKGSWLVKQSVGETPVLLGRKLTTKYFRCVAFYQEGTERTCGELIKSPQTLQVSDYQVLWRDARAPQPQAHYQVLQVTIVER